VLARPDDTAALEAAARAAEVTLTVEVGLSDEHLIARYRSALATVCAARNEPFGLTALESMACGTPVIAYRQGGYQESVEDGVTGMLVDPGPESLSSAIARLASEPALAERLGAAGREQTVESWSWESRVADLERVLEQARAA
jgi:glycosyltransferase involved in cell wall biosynthesis